MRLLLIIGVIALNLARFNAQSNDTISAIVTEVTKLSNQCALRLFKTMSDRIHRNFSTPGFQFYSTLYVAANAANGPTRDKISEVLQLPKDFERLLNGFEIITKGMKKTGSNKYMTNRFVHDRRVKIKPEFQLVLNKTSVTPFDLYSGAPLGILEGPPRAYFRGYAHLTCHLPLEMIASQDNSPFRDEMDLSVPLRVAGKFRIGRLSNLDATFVQIPCLNDMFDRSLREAAPEKSLEGPIYVFFIIPNDLDDFENLKKHVDEVDLRELFTAEARNVTVTLPRKMRSRSIVPDYRLPAIGVEKMFTDANDFTNMINNPNHEESFYDMLNEFEIDESLTLRNKTQSKPGIDKMKFLQIQANKFFINFIMVNPEDPLLLGIGHYKV